MDTEKLEQTTPTVQVTQNQPSQVTPSKPTNKLPIIVGLTILIIIGGAGLFFLGSRNTQQTMSSLPAPTSQISPSTVPTMTTYSDKTYGFSITYDNSFAVEPKKTGIEGIFQLCIYSVGGQAKPCTASVDVYENKQKIPLDQWTSLNATPILTYSGTAKPTKDTFNNYPAMSVANETERIHYVSNGSYIYKIHNVADAPPAEIANTFRFTE